MVVMVEMNEHRTGQLVTLIIQESLGFVEKYMDCIYINQVLFYTLSCNCQLITIQLIPLH